MIVRYFEETYGKRKKLISTTKLMVVCDCCKIKEWETFWYYKNKREFDYCGSCRNRLGISGMKGKKHSKETKEKFKNRNLGDSNPAKRKDVREKISKKLRGRKVPWLVGKKRPDHSKLMKERMLDVWNNDSQQNIEYRRKLLRNLRDIKKHSKLHDNVKKAMLENNIIGFQSEENVGKFIVDEINYNNKIIIEINGNFWHGNPVLFNKDEVLPFPGRKMLVEQIWYNDFSRKKYLESFGYIVLVVWEKEWKEDRDSILNKIKKFIGGFV